ncbi:MAG: RluA family pseudouridine synthase [Flavobacteriales bacterium]|nr:RluA family pseudouridine synthase [Bacteroidota bacterium]MCB9239555.1 RluA family pseudouridine synthase [Flavobacteriales bacterium]
MEWNIESAILYEDNHLIAVHKPAGMLVQSDETGDRALNDYVAGYIKRKYNKPGDAFVGTIHRLDRPVSGLVLFAKTSKALSRMNELFRDKKIQKTYLALVDSRPEKLSDTLVHYLTKDTQKNSARAFLKPGKDTKRAELSYDYIGTANHKYLIRVKPVTGRPHQIRVQLAKIGLPIVGDLKYGSPRGRGNFIYLHAKSLEFIHPVKKEKILLRCPLPDDVNWRFFESFEGAA